MRTIIRSMTKRVDPSRSKLRSANAARDAKDYVAAAGLYEAYLHDHPENARIHIQAGHMHKESGAMEKAGLHYLAAAKLIPDDADLQVQLGHYYKVTDRMPEAIAAYRRAVELSPEDEDARLQLEVARQAGTPQEPDFASRLTLLARARQNTEARDFLRNVPAEQFEAAAEGIRISGRYYLLDGVEQRFPDPGLSEAASLSCLALCIEAGLVKPALVIADSMLDRAPSATVPLSVLRLCLRAAQDRRDGAMVQAPLQAQVAVLGVATNLLARQRAIIDELMPMP